jgi:hypothetical protein
MKLNWAATVEIQIYSHHLLAKFEKVTLYTVNFATGFTRKSTNHSFHPLLLSSEQGKCSSDQRCSAEETYTVVEKTSVRVFKFSSLMGGIFCASDEAHSGKKRSRTFRAA